MNKDKIKNNSKRCSKKRNSKKIAIIANSLSRGGAEKVSKILVEWFYLNSIDISMITLSNSSDNSYELNNEVPFYEINDESKFGKISKISKLRKIVTENKFDTVVVMGTPLLLVVFPALILTRVKIITSERNDPSNFKGKKTTKYISRFFLLFTNGVIFQTRKAQIYYSKLIRNKSIIIKNPVQIDSVKNREINPNTNNIISVGRLVKQKNHKLLIDSFNSLLEDLPNSNLTIYGEGQCRKYLEEYIKELDIEDKVFLPGVSSNIHDIMLTSTIFVMSSDFEGLPNALIESISLGVPSISTDCPSGGPSEIISHEVNGLLVPTKSKKELCTAMKRLLTDKELYNRLEKNSSETRINYSPDIVCKEWIDYIVSV